ncbi:MAG: PEP-CTERM sorting domain-containing protein, partial [Pirellulales bacterium]|nr:PEP-CTERM sorting domain-containing protein [Pirellulales bacterium]
SNDFVGTDVSGMVWEYSVRMAVNTPGYPRTFFGVRDEGATGKFIMFAHASTGANLFYVVNAGGGVMGPDIYTGDVDGPSLGDGLMHDYRMVKYDDAGIMMLDFYLDSTRMDTRPYADFSDATTTDNGVGIFTSTPGTSDYVINELAFSVVPEPGSSMLLLGGLLMAALARRRTTPAKRMG